MSAYPPAPWQFRPTGTWHGRRVRREQRRLREGCDGLSPGAMVIFLPLVLTLLVLSALRGGTNVILLLPMVLTLGVGVVYIAIALRDGRRKKDPSIPVLPTSPLSRQLRAALRPQRPKRPRRPHRGE